MTRSIFSKLGFARFWLRIATNVTVPPKVKSKVALNSIGKAAERKAESPVRRLFPAIRKRVF